MGLNDRPFAPPARDAEVVEARLAALPEQLGRLIHQVGDSLDRGDLRQAGNLLDRAVAVAPGQPDIMRLQGLLLAQTGNFPAAEARFEAVLREIPDDPLTYFQYARICTEAGAADKALRLRRRAVERMPDSALAWADLGEGLHESRGVEESIDPLRRAAELAPDYAPVLLKYGSALVTTGRIDEGAAAIRRALSAEPAFGAAWLELSDIKTAPIRDDESEQMRGLLRGDSLSGSERTAVEFALARACESRGNYDEAFGLLRNANARRQRELAPWNAGDFVARMQRTNEAFSGTRIDAVDPRLGGEVIFIAGMPRSGTTLVEQILAAHPMVTGAGELGELAQVLTEESSRRRQRYPDWVPQATAEDWHRLGRRYLELTERFRTDAARFTDKMPNNWQAMGAIRAMLPGSRIVVSRRDPLENCWSCFKQYFPRGWEFTYDIEQLGMFWQAFDRAASWWAARDPAHIREQGYEALTEDPEGQTRALLEFCGLPFDPACLAFHQSRRNVHTLSAAQVRQPMRRHEARAANYGSLLDPLRKALGMPPFTSAAPDSAGNRSNPDTCDA